MVGEISAGLNLDGDTQIVVSKDKEVHALKENGFFVTSGVIEKDRDPDAKTFKLLIRKRTTGEQAVDTIKTVYYWFF